MKTAGETLRGRSVAAWFCGIGRWAMLWLAVCAAGAAEQELAARVIVLANRDDPDSLRVARYYAEARGVPPANVLALSMPLTEAISWREFVATIWRPLMEQLVAGRWIDAIAMDSVDALGRRKYAPHAHRIAALVVCRGVPLKISHDAELLTELKPLTQRAEFRTNAGAVDSELSLLPLPNYAISAWQQNPLFQNEHPGATELMQVIKVSRLDGPTAADALALVDHALAAERTGLLGRAYIDLSDRDALGNEWLRSTATQLATLGFDTSIDHAPATFPVAARFDAPVLYFGWYTEHVEGPFTLPGFRFPPGAIALHIHSFSAATLRSNSAGWTGPLVARGVTATVGNVHEPYLELTHQPHLFLRALVSGETLVDAAYFSLQALSWQAILIGDPLFRPFARKAGGSRPDERATPPRGLAGYAALRRMHELDAAGQRGEATAALRAAHADAPNLAVGLALARRLEEAGKLDEAVAVFAFVSGLSGLKPSEWGLAREAAVWLASVGRPAPALPLWRAVLAGRSLPHELHVAWLAEAISAATAARDAVQAAQWERERDMITRPLEKK